jgi:hypothetical protein
MPLKPCLDNQLIAGVLTGLLTVAVAPSIAALLWLNGQLAKRLMNYTKPKLLIIDGLGCLPFEDRSAHLFRQLCATSADGRAFAGGRLSCSGTTFVISFDLLMLAVLPFVCLIKALDPKLTCCRHTRLNGSAGAGFARRRVEFRRALPLNMGLCIRG